MCAALVAILTLASCGTRTESAPLPPSESSGIDLKPDTTGAGTTPGALFSATTLPTIERNLKAATSLAARVSYTSTSGITDDVTEVTAAVFVPAGTPPPGGWPIVVYAHATTGISPECAPSRSPNLLGTSSQVQVFLEAGYLVVAPDYQGLGLDHTYHPYLDSTTAGYNVIDSVRAARHLVPTASDRWLAVGQSQGGQAAWAANELAATYGTGLTLQGSVSIAPPTDITGYVTSVEAGTLTREQKGTFQLILAALKAEHPDLNLDDYRRGLVEERWALMSSCQFAQKDERQALLDQISADDLRPSSPEAAATLLGHLTEMGLPKRPTAAPMLVIYGGKDTHQLAEWTERALASACGMGDVIDIRFDANRGHSDVDATAAISWINSRFANNPPPDGCAAPQP